MNLFDDSAVVHGPLAARMRPRSLDDYVGQAHILGKGRPLRQSIASGHLHSMLFWGPPGVGKTTLARLLASAIDAHFISLSAVLAGVKDIRTAVSEAQQRSCQTILFIDEVHRFNKAQQDAFLPFVEDGTFIFVGATTENPSFEVNNALLSRCRTYVLKKLDEPSLTALLQRSLSDDERGLGRRQLALDTVSQQLLIQAADGDARRMLNILEIVSDLVEDNSTITEKDIASVLGEHVAHFDKGGDAFYELISALHKSVRGSDPDASLYWLMRMLSGGCDPLYIARRLIRIASEDIGNADPRALDITMHAWDVQSRLGSPEGELALAQAILYLAAAPKSNAVYNAFKAAKSAMSEHSRHDVPVHLRNAPTTLMKELGYGHEYRYAHNEPGAFAAGERYFPDDMEEQRYYQPVERGLEIKIAEKLRQLQALNKSARKQK